jgi:hypothetical protein
VLGFGIAFYERLRGKNDVALAGVGGSRWSLTSVTIPSGEVGEWAFSGCAGLTNVIVGRGVTTIYDTSFDDCPNLQSFNVDARTGGYSSVEGALFNKKQTTLILCPNGIRQFHHPQQHD